MRWAGLLIVFLSVVLVAGSVRGQETMPATAVAPRSAQLPTLTLTTSTEEGKKNLVATVMLNDKPVEGVTVAFLVRRTFGKMELGQDKTLDDGTAAIAFPSDLPGGTTGILHILTEIRLPAPYAGVRVEADLPGGAIAPLAEPYPRALWTPQAPWSLILVILALLAGAWGTYAYVLSQLLVLRKGAAK